uniref:cingulin-like isoform X2 n=1 Tax=Myxine glutinosa TaxID=7769 RepID=UPI00358E77CB
MADQDSWGPVEESEVGSIQDQIEGQEESEAVRAAGSQNSVVMHEVAAASTPATVVAPLVDSNLFILQMRALMEQMGEQLGDQIRGLKSSMGQMGNRMEAQNEQLGVMGNRMDAQGEQLWVMRDEARGTGEGLDKKLEGLDNGIEGVKHGLTGVENRMAAQENQMEGMQKGLEGLENTMEGKLRDMRDQAEREVNQMGQQIEGVRMGVETKLDAHREEMEQMRVASGQEMQVMGEEIRGGVSEEVGGVREEVRHCKEHMEKEVRKGTVKLQGGIEDLTQEVEQLTVGQTELVEQVQRNTAVLGGLKATQNDIKNDLIATKRECQMVREGLTTRLDEVIEVMETKDRQVMEEKRRGRGPGVSGDQYGRAYDAPGDLRSLGVEMDPGVRERPLVKCATGLVCEKGGVRESPTLGCVRKKCVPRSEGAGESESVVARVRGGTWKRGVVSVTEDVTGECARGRCVTDRCTRKECAVKSKGECVVKNGGESSESDMERELVVTDERGCTPGMEGCTPGMVEREWECTLELVVRHMVGCANEGTPVIVTEEVTEEGAQSSVLVRCASNECVPQCSVVRCVTKAVSGMRVPGCVRKGTRSMGTAGCVSKERAAGCKHAGEASTLDGVEFRTTYSRIGPSVRAGPRFERPRPCSTRRSGRQDRKGRHGDHFLVRHSGRPRSSHGMAPCRDGAWDLGPGKPPSLHRMRDVSSRRHKTTSIHCSALRSRALDRNWRTERY